MKQIAKANRLVEAHYKSSTAQQALFMAALSRLDSMEKYPPGHLVRITLGDWQQTAGTSRSSVQDWQTLTGAADELFDSRLWIHVKPGHLIQFRWLQEKATVESRPTEKYIELMFTQAVMDSVTDIHNRFTKYSTDAAIQFSSKYAIRFYEWMMQWKGAKKRTLDIKVSEIRERLQLQDKLSEFANLRMRCIEPAIADINDKTDLTVKVEYLKVGKYIETVRLRWNKKKPKTPEPQVNQGEKKCSASGKKDTKHVSKYIEEMRAQIHQPT